jgi:hypothetical protein
MAAGGILDEHVAAELYFKTLRCEVVYRKVYRTFAEARNATTPCTTPSDDTRASGS